MHGRLLAAGSEEDVGIQLGDALRIEKAESCLQRRRTCKRLLHRDLLVEREANQQRVRVRRDQSISSLITSPREQRGAGHD